MQVKLLQTQGQGHFEEVIWTKPEIAHNEIEVKSIYTGICRSDIDMMMGTFPALPQHMMGHEGLGRVTKVGSSVQKIYEGDIVATRGEPAYAEYYNSKIGEFIRVPKIEPKYIIEPVACGVNLVYQNIRQIFKLGGQSRRLLILGSGFLAQVAYQTIKKYYELNFEIDVVGNHNKEVWGDLLKSKPQGTYDVIIDLSSGTDVFDSVLYNENALIIIGSDKTVTTSFANMLWKSVTINFPSPRNPSFYKSMEIAVELVKLDLFDPTNYWTKGYDRNDWQSAFEDGKNRPASYNRGYLKFNT